MRKSVITILLTGVCSAAIAVSAFAAGWEQTGGAWNYIDENGNALKGWQNIKEQNNDNTHWYYFDPDTGAMATGWQEIKEQNSEAKHYYYFDEVNGAMWVDMTTPDGNYVNADGVWLEEGKEAASGNGGAAANDQPEAEDSSSEANSGNGVSKEASEKLISLINGKRREAGLSELKTDEGLTKGAEIRAEELTRSYSSSRPDGSKAKSAIEEWDKYSALVEIKDKSASAERTIENWYSEDTSEKEVLTDVFSQGGKTFTFTDIGAGCYIQDGVYYYAVFLNGHSN